MTKPDGRVQRSESTRAALVDAARTLFVAHGYTAVSTADIARAAEVTRNALYYHFPTKEALFRAVYEDVEGKLAERVIPAAQHAPVGPAQLEAGFQAFLDGCLDPTVARISIVEAPVALGFTQMREIDNHNYLEALQTILQEAMDRGALRRLPVGTLAAMLIGALDEAALLIASAEDPVAARAEAGAAASALVAGLFAATKSVRVR
jgi:AcrR family transcriptional regulator